MSECDIDGILCELETLQHLTALERLSPNESLMAKYPELSGLKDKLSDELKLHRGNLKLAVEQCGKLPEELSEFEEELTSIQETSDG